MFKEMMEKIAEDVAEVPPPFISRGFFSGDFYVHYSGYIELTITENKKDCGIESLLKEFENVLMVDVLPNYLSVAVGGTYEEAVSAIERMSGKALEYFKTEVTKYLNTVTEQEKQIVVCVATISFQAKDGFHEEFLDEDTGVVNLEYMHETIVTLAPTVFKDGELVTISKYIESMEKASSIIEKLTKGTKE